MGTNATALYSPPQWQAQSPAKTIISFPGLGSAAPQYSSSASGSGAALPQGQTLYAFDAELIVDHEQRIRKTEHPVQTGASISDHAFVEPARLVLDIMMSDAIDAYYSPTTWSGSSSKSVSAYQTMLALAFARIPLTITTRLRTYENMIVELLHPVDTYKTSTSLSMRVEFGQIFMATTTNEQVSVRMMDTGETNLGAVNPEPPTASQVTQNYVETDPPAQPSTAIGAGDWSSANWNSNSSWYSMIGVK